MASSTSAPAAGVYGAEAMQGLVLRDQDMEKQASCPACGAGDRADFARHTFADRRLQFVRCRQCSHVYLDPVPTQAWYDGLYAHSFWEAKTETQQHQTVAANRTQWRKGLQRADKLIDALRGAGAVFPADGALLEVGCSFGVIARRVAEAFGLRAHGIEPSVAARQFAERVAGVRIVAPTMSDLAARKETDGFCLIYFSHVLENIVDLDGTMALVREHLRDGGWLVIETPNIRFPPSYSIFHPNCFSPRSLGLLLRRHGLQVARLSPSGRPATRLSPRYLTAVAQKSEEHAGAEALKGGAPSTDGLVMKTGHLWYRLASRPPLRLLDRWLTARAYPTTPEQRRALADIEALAERQNQDATD